MFGTRVKGITSYLTVPDQTTGNPYQLVVNRNKYFIGSYVLGMGFTLEPKEAEALITKNSNNKDVLFPYLKGKDLNHQPDQAPSNWVINFFDWPLSAEHDDPKKPKGAPYASDYPDCLEIVERLVKPERDRNNRKIRREKWWQFAEKCPALYKSIKELSNNGNKNSNRVLVTAAVSGTFGFDFQPTNIVFSHKIIVFIFTQYFIFSCLQSNIHKEWAFQYSSTLGGQGNLNYSPTDCFETFPFPNLTPTHQQQLEDIGKRYYEHRQTIMQRNQEGLTKTYNRFHDPDETDPDIQKLRELHIEMDNAVAIAYGWNDLELNHDFHNTKQGLRFTISETARREILDRLLQLNHQRYAEEVKQGLHDKTKKKANKTKKIPPKDPNQLGLDL